MQKILITGGGGFIGSHLVATYQDQGFQVAIIDNFSSGRKAFLNEDVIIFEGLIEDEAFVEATIQSFKPDIISHHAAHISVIASIDNPSMDAERNILGSINIFHAGGKAGVKQIIFASSGGAIVPTDNTDFPTKEIGQVSNLGSPYALSKQTAEAYLHYFAKQYNFTPTVLRYSNVYGPHQTPKSEAGVIAIFSEMLTQNQTPTIFGDGKQTRDFIFVKDVADAHLSTTQNNMEGTFNVSTGQETSIYEIYRLMAQALEHNDQPHFQPSAQGDVQRSALSSDYLQSKTNWKPQIAIHDGISQTIAWAQTFYA